jgi:ankyrin repeat protein
MHEDASLISTEKSTGNTLLHASLLRGHNTFAKNLAEKGVHIITPNNHGETPLHFAVRGKRLDVVRILLAKGASPRTKNNTGIRPMDLPTSPRIAELLKMYALKEGSQ